MRMRSLPPALCAVLVALILSASCGKSSPTAPTTPTRIINITGNLGFGQMTVGDTAQRTVQVANTGTGDMTVTAIGSNGLTIDASENPFSASWISGTIVAGGSQSITIFFHPTKVQSYVGNFVVQCDCTGGFNTLPLTANVVAAAQ